MANADINYSFEIMLCSPPHNSLLAEMTKQHCIIVIWHQSILGYYESSLRLF